MGLFDWLKGPKTTAQTEDVIWLTRKAKLAAVPRQVNEALTLHSRRLCAKVANRPETTKRCNVHTNCGVVPNFVLEESGVDLWMVRAW